MAIFGAMTALVTPFKNGKLDEVAYERLIKRQIEGGIDAVSPVGTTGESATLTHEEHKCCIDIAVSVCKNSGVKVLAGAGSNATHEAVELAKFAQNCGADAILSVAPYYNKPTQEGLFLHYQAIANSVEIPVMLYNVPGRTGSDILPQTAVRLFEACKNIYAIKDASGDIERCIQTLALAPKMAVFSGDDAMNYPMLACGAKGVVSVTSNLLPNKVSTLTHSVFEGRFEAANEISNELFELNSVLFCESNPIPLKAAMFAVGLLETLEYRLPLCPPSKENFAKIETVVKKFF